MSRSIRDLHLDIVSLQFWLWDMRGHGRVRLRVKAWRLPPDQWQAAWKAFRTEVGLPIASEKVKEQHFMLGGVPVCIRAKP